MSSSINILDIPGELHDQRHSNNPPSGITSKASLLGLPGELRNRIYDFALTDAEYMEVNFYSYGNKVKVVGKSTGITPTALIPFNAHEKLKSEAFSYFWSQNHFRILEQQRGLRSHTVLHAFLAYLGHEGRELIQHLDIRNAGPVSSGYVNPSNGYVKQMFRRSFYLLRKCTSLRSLYIDLDLQEVYSRQENDNEVLDRLAVVVAAAVDLRELEINWVRIEKDMAHLSSNWNHQRLHQYKDHPKDTLVEYLKSRIHGYSCILSSIEEIKK